MGKKTWSQSTSRAMKSQVQALMKCSSLEVQCLHHLLLAGSPWVRNESEMTWTWVSHSIQHWYPKCGFFSLCDFFFFKVCALPLVRISRKHGKVIFLFSSQCSPFCDLLRKFSGSLDSRAIYECHLCKEASFVEHLTGVFSFIFQRMWNQDPFKLKCSKLAGKDVTAVFQLYRQAVKHRLSLGCLTRTEYINKHSNRGLNSTAT